MFSENLSAILSEHEELTTEHESLTSRHDKLLVDMEASETKWRQKVQQTEEQCLLKLQQQNELVDQLRNENILTSTAFKVSQLALTKLFRLIVNDSGYCTIFNSVNILHSLHMLSYATISGLDIGCIDQLDF